MVIRNKYAMMLLTLFLAAVTIGTAAAEIDNLQTSNLTSSSTTITWISPDSVDGCVRYGLTTALGDSANDTTVGNVHFVETAGLDADETYFFEVRSGSEVDDNEGSYYTFATTMVGAGIPYIIYGTVLDEGSPVERALVVAVLRDNGDNSYPLAALTDVDGIWYLNLANLKNLITNTVYAYALGDTIVVDIQADTGRVVTDTSTVSGSSPQDLGTITFCDCTGFCDLNLDGGLNPIDVVLIVNYVYKNLDLREPIPLCLADQGDWNCDGAVNPVDVVRYVNFVYKNIGDVPCDPCTCGPYPDNCP